MSEKETKPKASITIGVDELQAILDAQRQSNENALSAAFEKLSNALIESRKPYVSDAQKQNEEAIRKSDKAQFERIQQDRLENQKYCPHIQGSNSLSDVPTPTAAGSFALHQLDTGELIGICTNCGKIIRQTNPEDRQFFTKKMAGKMSRAGARMFSDPKAVMRIGAGLPPEEN